MIRLFLLFLGCWLGVLRQEASGASDSTAAEERPNYRRLHGIFAAQTVLYAGSLYGLSTTWYQNPLTTFTIRDDFHEWKQMDKVGHVYTAYQISRHMAALYQTTGITPTQAAIYGGIAGIVFQTPIEILDGFSDDYGFSPTDMVANVVGAGLFVGQHALWREQRILPKYSFSPTSLAQERPELLGKNFSEQWLKDYNGQTYWFSASPAAFGASRWPPWLCISVGYGVHNMISAEVGRSRELGFSPYRQYYLSFDVDFTKLKSNKKWVKTLGFLLNTIKIPAPTLELSRGRIRAYPIYF